MKFEKKGIEEQKTSIPRTKIEEKIQFFSSNKPKGTVNLRL